MAVNLDLLREQTQARFRTIRGHITDLPSGRGGEWKALLSHVLSEFARDVQITEDQIERARTQPPDIAEQARSNAAQHLERLQGPLDTLHFYMATYRSAVARSDVPVGLQHLIDVLMEDILLEKGDPIIHLDARNMYSTIDVTGPMNSLIAALEPPYTFYSGAHPIAFHLPALDPNNVLLAPVLAHEVAHTAVSRKLLPDLLAQLPAAAEGATVQSEFAAYAAGATQEATDSLISAFQSWTSELLCDAVAIAVSGPSFLFAFTAFATPSSSYAAGPTHPETHDRIRFALCLVDHLGWTPFMTARAPELMGWLHTVAGLPVLTGSPEETFLRRAVDLTETLRRDIALGHIVEHFTPNGAEARLDQASEWLGQGVPLIDIDDEALAPWAAILAGWLAAINNHGDRSSSIALGAGSTGFNAVIVKALEYSQIVSAWRKS